MEVKTFRASSMQEALRQIRTTLGPDAAVLQAREIRRGIVQWLTGSRRIEVVASADVQVPTRLPESAAPAASPQIDAGRESLEAGDNRSSMAGIAGYQLDYRSRFRASVLEQGSDLHSPVEDLAGRRPSPVARNLPEALFHLFTDLIDAEIDEDLARELVDRLRQATADGDMDDPLLLKTRIAKIIQEDIRVCGPIQVQPGETRVVALVGPTGVGKTTTIAKLAANYRLREKRRIGLITVDTYRIAAVQQLRTYAEIIDLPMEVVSTPAEMRQAVDRLSGMELILVDTAGRSPRDELKVQELRSMLGEAEADEVHLVLSSTASARSLTRAAEQLAEVGVTALLVTKLDEATGLGNLVALARSCRLPFSYVTNGQNVPDDIEPADCRRLTRSILGMESI
jgi:flagellar biosynthesis protein FlhF